MMNVFSIVRKKSVSREFSSQTERTVNGKSFRDWLKDTFLDFLNSSGEMLENAITYVIDGIKDITTNDTNKE